MRRWIVAAGVAAALAGCQTSLKEVKQEAQLRWQNTRARVAYGLALEQFKAGQLDPALAKVQEALALAPEDGEARLLLGKVLIGQGRYAPGIPELLAAGGRLPRSFEAAFLLGVAQEKAGRLDEALASYRKAQGLDPSDLGAVMATAEVLVAIGQVLEAQALVESRREPACEEPGMFELAGRLAMMLEDYPAAADRYAEALDLEPANVRYREALAEAQFLCRRYAEAAETLRLLLQAPKYAPPSWVQTMLGECYMALGRPAEARTAYTAARDLAPAEAETWTNLAKAMLALDDVLRAATCAQEALRRDPKGPDAFLVLGYSLLRDGQAQKARQVLAGAVEAFPQQAVLRCLLGRAFAALGDAAQAAHCYAAALRIAPDNALAKELLAGADEPRPASAE